MSGRPTATVSGRAPPPSSRAPPPNPSYMPPVSSRGPGSILSSYHPPSSHGAHAPSATAVTSYARPGAGSHVAAYSAARVGGDGKGSHGGGAGSADNGGGGNSSSRDPAPFPKRASALAGSQAEKNANIRDELSSINGNIAVAKNSKGRGKTIGSYVLGKSIGEGTFGKVKAGTHMLTGEKVAIKILEKSRIIEVADVKRVTREIKILKRNRHRNIIQLFEVLDTPTTIYLIMENADGGEMFDYIVQHQKVEEKLACSFFHQLVDGCEYLHQMEVTHRDLKPENLLLQSSSEGWIIKIVDFGLSNTHEGGRLLQTACGSPCYAAPEMIAGKKYVGPKADVWSIGVILFALVSGYLPFEDSNTSALYKKILAGDYKTPDWLSPEVKDLIRRILNTDPETRYNIDSIRRHPWYNIIDFPTPAPYATADKVEIDKEVMSQLAALDLQPNAVMDSLKAGAHNNLTSSYYLLLNRKSRNKEKQVLRERQYEDAKQKAKDDVGILAANLASTSVSGGGGEEGMYANSAANAAAIPRLNLAGIAGNNGGGGGGGSQPNGRQLPDFAGGGGKPPKGRPAGGVRLSAVDNNQVQTSQTSREQPTQPLLPLQQTQHQTQQQQQPYTARPSGTGQLEQERRPSVTTGRRPSKGVVVVNEGGQVFVDMKSGAGGTGGGVGSGPAPLGPPGFGVGSVADSALDASNIPILATNPWADSLFAGERPATRSSSRGESRNGRDRQTHVQGLGETTNPNGARKSKNKYGAIGAYPIEELPEGERASERERNTTAAQEAGMAQDSYANGATNIGGATEYVSPRQQQQQQPQQQQTQQPQQPPKQQQQQQQQQQQPQQPPKQPAPPTAMRPSDQPRASSRGGGARGGRRIVDSSAASSGTAATLAAESSSSSSPSENDELPATSRESIGDSLQPPPTSVLGVSVVSSTSSKPLVALYSELRKACKARNITFKQFGGHTLMCETATNNGKVTFNLEVSRLGDLERMHVIKGSVIKGDENDFKSICSVLFNAMKLF